MRSHAKKQQIMLDLNFFLSAWIELLKKSIAKDEF